MRRSRRILLPFFFITGVLSGYLAALFYARQDLLQGMFATLTALAAVVASYLFATGKLLPPATVDLSPQSTSVRSMSNAILLAFTVVGSCASVIQCMQQSFSPSTVQRTGTTAPDSAQKR